MFYLLPHSLGPTADPLLFVCLHGEGMMKFSSAITMSCYITIHFDHKDVFNDVWLMVSPLECSNEREDAMNHQSDSFLFFFFFIFRNKYFHCLSIPLFGMFCIIHVTHVAALFSIILNIMYIILHIQ